MKVYKVNRPSQEHIKKMLKKAKETNKRQLEVLGMNEDLLYKIETPFDFKTTLHYKIKNIDNEKHINNESN